MRTKRAAAARPLLSFFQVALTVTETTSTGCRENTIRTAIDPSRRLRIRPYLFWGGNVGKLETEPDTQGTQFAFVEASSSGMRDMLDQRMRSRMQNRIDP